MRVKDFRYFSCDFETTVYDGQVATEVWAAACVELFTEEVVIFHSISELYEHFKSLKSNLIAYFHNLKFDGSFWLSYLLVNLKLEQACIDIGDDKVEWLSEKDMLNNTFKYSISDKGQWYNIIIKTNNKIIEIRDSLKLLPFSVKRIGESFGTKHKKLEMEYKGFRYAGCEITTLEKEYIANDVLVVKEALEIMFNEGHKDLTIGSCCLKEFKKTKGKEDYDMFFPDLYDIEIDKNTYKYENAGAYIRRSYKGGWCYLARGKEGKIYKNGSTFDVNSLYPSVMSSESGNRYPVGKPQFWKGNYIPDDAIAENKYFFVRVKTRFYIKKNMLPFIQIKNSLMYKGTEALETSDIWDEEKQEYFPFYTAINGELKDTRVELTFTMPDYYLFLKHYNVVDFEILDGCYFYSEIGLFDDYIEKYKKIKLTSKGALRELAKLFLNNLYGKLASSIDSSFKLAYVKEDSSLGFKAIPEHNKKAGYIACGSAVTSYARCFTITAAQKNYHGVNEKGFIYADTDSIHCDLLPDEVVGVPTHESNFCMWKCESTWDEAIFTRQKTYIEHVIEENKKPVTPYYQIKCAGMTRKCKELFELSMTDIDEETMNKYNEEEQEFLKTKRTMKDFKVGLSIPGKLRPKRIKGGILLVDTTYKMK